MNETQETKYDQHELETLLTNQRSTRIMRHNAAAEANRHAAHIRPSCVSQKESQQQHKKRKICKNKRKIIF